MGGMTAVPDCLGCKKEVKHTIVYDIIINILTLLAFLWLAGGGGRGRGRGEVGISF